MDGPLGIPGVGTAIWLRNDNGVSLHLWRKTCGFDVEYVEAPDTAAAPGS